MNLLRSAVVAAMLASTSSSSVATDRPPIKQFVAFGDSLMDAGTYWFRFTTNPGLTFAQHLSVRYRQMPVPNEHLDDYDDAYKGVHATPGPGGLNYAEGGAKANSPYSTVSDDPEGAPISAAVQLRHFLAQHQRFAPDQLVGLYVGTNDVGYHYDDRVDPKLGKQLRDNITPSPEVMGQEKARVEAAADDTAQVARDILAQGAERLLVFKLADMGDLPWFHSQASQAYADQLSRAFNDRLLAKLPQDPQRLLVIDTGAFLGGLKENAAKYGFTHGAHEDACREDDQDFCFAETSRGADADRTYIFAAGEHMTTHTNELFAEYVLRQVQGSPLK